jgi:uroporphyrinogen-III synthase
MPQTKSILLTRSSLENAILAKSLSNYDLVKISLLEYSDIDFDYAILANYSDIIITSKYAAQRLKSAVEIGCKDIWVVGKASAQILAEKGHSTKFIAENVRKLQEQIPKELHKNMVYLSGDQITLDFPLSIKRHIIYSVEYRQDLTEEQIQRIKNGIDYILLYSENCAKTLVKLLLNANLLKYLANSVIFLISSKLEKEVVDYFKNIIICNKPTEMLERAKSYDQETRRRN